MIEPADTRFTQGQMPPPFYPNFPYHQPSAGQQYNPEYGNTLQLMGSLRNTPSCYSYYDQSYFANPHAMYDQRWFPQTQGGNYIPGSPPEPMDEPNNFENTNSTPSPCSNIMGLSSSSSDNSPSGQYYPPFPKTEAQEYHEVCSPPNSVETPIVQMGPVTPITVKSEPHAMQSHTHNYDWMKRNQTITANQSDDSDELTRTQKSGKTRTKDKYRVVYTDLQRTELEKEFVYGKYITIKRKAELAQVLDLSERQVKIWFQNRRAKERKLKGKPAEQRTAFDENQMHPELRAHLAQQQHIHASHLYMQQQQQHHQQQMLHAQRVGRS